MTCNEKSTPKSEGIVSGMLDHLGFTGVGKSGRYPTGVKYDALVALSEAVLSDEKMHEDSNECYAYSHNSKNKKEPN